MRIFHITSIALMAIAGLTHAPGASADFTWFGSEGEAIETLAEESFTPVFECTGCDGDNAQHRVTHEFILRLLGELRDNEFADSGSFLLRERARPRFHHRESYDEESGAVPPPASCPGKDWSPSVTLWAYDLGRFTATPLYTGCYPIEVEERIARVRCYTDCNLDLPTAEAVIVEQLQALHQHVLQDGAMVDSGRIFFIDLGNRAFRQMDYRAFSDYLYVGPVDGEYYRLSMAPSAGAAELVTGVRAAVR